MPDTAKLADAESYEEFKALRHTPAETPKAEPEPAADPKEPPTPPSDKGSESAEVSETSENKAQQEAEKPRERSLEARVKELRAKGKDAEADKILRDAWLKEERAEREKAQRELEDTRKELQEFRTRKPAPEQPKAGAQPKPEAKPVADPSDPEPKIDDEKYQAEGGYEKYLRDSAIWAFRQEQRASEQKQQQQAFAQRAQQLIGAGRQAHADFDAVANRVTLNTSVLRESLQKLENIAEVLYKVGSDPTEAARIAALDPMDQWAELRSVSRELAKPAAQGAPPPAEQPKPKPAVTKATPPPRQLNGGRDDGELPKLSEARDYEEFKNMRRRRAS